MTLWHLGRFLPLKENTSKLDRSRVIFKASSFVSSFLHFFDEIPDEFVEFNLEFLVTNL